MPPACAHAWKLYYKRRRRLYAQDFPDFFDADLKKLFVDGSHCAGRTSAPQFFCDDRAT